MQSMYKVGQMDIDDRTEKGLVYILQIVRVYLLHGMFKLC
jgi:hypothetical protein